MFANASATQREDVEDVIISIVCATLVVQQEGLGAKVIDQNYRYGEDSEEEGRDVGEDDTFIDEPGALDYADY